MGAIESSLGVFSCTFLWYTTPLDLKEGFPPSPAVAGFGGHRIICFLKVLVWQQFAFSVTNTQITVTTFLTQKTARKDFVKLTFT